MLSGVVEFALEIDERCIDERRHRALEERSVGVVDLRRDFQRHVRAPRDTNRSVRSRRRRDPPDECEMAIRVSVEWKQRRGHSVRHGAYPAGPRQGRALRVRDRYEWHVGKAAVERIEPRNIEAPVQRRDMRGIEPARVRKAHVVRMKCTMSNWPVCAYYVFEHREVKGLRIGSVLDEPHSAWRARHELRARLGIRAGEQSDVVAHFVKLFGQPGYGTLDATVAGKTAEAKCHRRRGDGRERLSRRLRRSSRTRDRIEDQPVDTYMTARPSGETLPKPT
ncbi:hypothetical protein [Caballeronia sp. S22]|uniref:hypothetical protein n=1 Tax=Caballeronia sp. S22 TaxID=3137182 RepID=UPI00353167B5